MHPKQLEPHDTSSSEVIFEIKHLKTHHICHALSSHLLLHSFLMLLGMDPLAAQTRHQECDEESHGHDADHHSHDDSFTSPANTIRMKRQSIITDLNLANIF